MANGQQGGSGGGAGYAAIIPQLVGAGLQIATARPTRQERQQRRIAMGAPDPAVEALRRRLATQQLQNATALAAAVPGINLVLTRHWPCDRHRPAWHRVRLAQQPSWHPNRPAVLSRPGPPIRWLGAVMLP